jgi:hypothetical protein
MRVMRFKLDLFGNFTKNDSEIGIRKTNPTSGTSFRQERQECVFNQRFR